MKRRLPSFSLASVGLALALGACTAPDLSPPCPVKADATQAERDAALRQCYGSQSDDPVDTRLKKDVDILFVIDNSVSMSPKQRVLTQNIPKFIQAIEATGANYHVGVVTTDVGTLTAEGVKFQGSEDVRCNSFKGDDGLLQNIPCTSRINPMSADKVGISPEDAVPACNTLCPDPRYVPTDGKRYISKQDGIYNVLAAKDGMGKDSFSLGAENTFKCIALVGDAGCGIESPFEAAKRALDGHLQENDGFLRKDSVLAIIFITDEDDCSVQLSKRAENNPNSTNCAAPNADAPYSCFGIDYRCFARSVTCDTPMNVAGAKMNCVEKPNSYLEPIDKYVKFFSSLRGGDKLVIAGIWSPSVLDFVATDPQKKGQVVIEQNDASTGSFGLNRGWKDKAACYNPAIVPARPDDVKKGFIGQAQLRLSSFIRRFAPDNREESFNICDTDNYAQALGKISDKISNKARAYCLGVNPKVVNGKPVCVVGEVDANSPNASPDTLFPVCGGSATSACCQAWAAADSPKLDDPGIRAACAGEAATCFCALPATIDTATGKPKNCADTAVAGVWYKGGADPTPGKVVNFKCSGTRPLAAPTM